MLWTDKVLNPLKRKARDSHYLSGAGQSESHAARESLENFLGEYLLRILQRMELWVARQLAINV